MPELDPVVVHHIINSLGWPDLRPLQREAIGPLLAGQDAILVAPTAGGKTEAAIFPLLTAMAAQRWDGTSVLYVCPLKALLNNLLPRLQTYTAWMGRTTAMWHGDVPASQRRSILHEHPDILLTTPESLESMLVSTHVDHGMFFAGLRTVVIDEVHAFAGDDRGWHLLCVLERLTHLVRRPIQRIGLSATVGNPTALLGWLQGSGVSSRPATVVAPGLTKQARDEPPHSAVRAADVELDFAGSLANAAKVIAALHQGEKRLVFCEARQTVEELGALLRGLGVTTYLSHASLAADERKRAEAAFAEARDCVIVSTSTLELGIDVGDLDRVIQINAPGTVASFLQRLGRTGRRPNTSRNMLFLAVDGESLVEAAALLLLWNRGYVEPVTAPPEPRHIVAQQILALSLQEGRIGENLWRTWWNGLAPFGPGAEVILRHLVEHGFLDSDGGMLFIGPNAEKQFGRRHFSELLAAFTVPTEFTVYFGRQELGRIDPSLLTEEVKGDRRLLLAGRSWAVTYVDWKRRRCFVEPVDGGGRARWVTGAGAWSGLSHALARAMRDVLLGSDPAIRMTRRCLERLALERSEMEDVVHPEGNVIRRRRNGDLHWWTWGGWKANATLAASLGGLADPTQRFDDLSVRLREDLTPQAWRAGIAGAADRLCLPEVSEKAVQGLKFNAALPERLAVATLAARSVDLTGAAAILDEPARFVAG